MPEPSTELTIVNPTTGERLDLNADPELFARALDELRAIRQQLADFEDAVQAVLLRHMNREAATTLRLGDYELKVPGADAGTKVYDPNVLEEVLGALIEADAISETAAKGALKRRVTLTLSVPFALDLAEVAKSIDGKTFAFAGRELEMTLVDHSATPVVAGINALGKLPGVGELLDRARERSVAAPKRRVKVTFKGRPS